MGFDLEKYDFVTPHGKGIEKDMLLRFTLHVQSIINYRMTMEVSFTNNLYAGAYELPRMKTSEFQSVYHADTNATYRQSLVFIVDETKGNIPKHDKLSDDKYLIFRVRTKVDSQGNLISAHYGKIYGPWKFVGIGGMSMSKMMFNSIPNDTNLEDLHSAERSRRMRESLEMRPGEKRKHMDGNPFKTFRQFSNLLRYAR